MNSHHAADTGPAATRGEPTPIDTARLARALALRDLTDPAAGEHAVQHVVAAVERALVDAWALPVRRDPGERIVTVADNYDRLRYSPDAVTRDRRYSRYVGGGRVLRSHTTQPPGSGQHTCRMYRSTEVESLVASAGARLLGRSASNWASLGDAQALATLAADPARWARFVDNEVAMCAQPGVWDGGTHLLFAAAR